jgi:hypothetical protein
MRAHVRLDAATQKHIDRCESFYGRVSLSALVRRALALLNGHVSAVSNDPAAATIERARLATFITPTGPRRGARTR